MIYDAWPGMEVQGGGSSLGQGRNAHYLVLTAGWLRGCVPAPTRKRRRAQA